MAMYLKQFIKTKYISQFLLIYLMSVSFFRILKLKAITARLLTFKFVAIERQNIYVDLELLHYPFILLNIPVKSLCFPTEKRNSILHKDFHASRNAW